MLNRFLEFAVWAGIFVLFILPMKLPVQKEEPCYPCQSF